MTRRLERWLIRIITTAVVNAIRQLERDDRSHFASEALGITNEKPRETC